MNETEFLILNCIVYGITSITFILLSINALKYGKKEIKIEYKSDSIVDAINNGEI